MLFFLAAKSPLYAVSAAPNIHDLKQPEGAAIVASQWGDEYSHGWETDTGHTIVFDKAKNGWAYAIHDNDGKLVSSSVLVDRTKSPPENIQKNLRPRQKDMKWGAASLSTSTDSGSVVSSASASPQLMAAVIGTKSLPVILIGFTDAPFSKTKADFDNLLFGVAGNTMRNYYLENSYNQLTVNGGATGVYGPLVSNNLRTYYGSNNTSGKDQKPGTLVYEAISKAAALGFKFAPFVDQTKSCTVDAVVIVHQGTGEESGFDANDIWSHSWDLNSAQANGKSDYGAFVTDEPCTYPGGGFIKVNNYTIQPELAVPNGTMIGVGVFAHEYGHALGLPDLYDTDDTSRGAGYWTLMASGSWLGKTVAYNKYLYNIGDSPSHLDPWSKYFLGWISPVDVVGINQNIAVAAASSSTPNFYQIGTGSPSTGEYFLVENRQKTGFDTYIKGSGLLVWHIDGATISNLYSSNMVNNNECVDATPGACPSYNSHYGVALVQADNLLSLEKKIDKGSIDDPFFSPKTLTDATGPNSKLWSGAASGWSITAISAAANTMTATLAGSPAIPSVSSNAASGVQAATATLNGLVNDNNAVTAVTFDYGLTTAYGSTLSGGSVVAGAGTTAVAAPLSGLSCNSTYHFRVKAINSVGTGYGSDRSFTTTACVPGAPTIISVSAGNAVASISFAPPLSDGGSAITGFTVTPSDGPAVSGFEVPIIVTSLNNGTPYTFTVKATNAAGAGPVSAASAIVTPGIAVIDDADETGYRLLQDAYDADISGKKIKLLAGAAVGEFTVNPLNAKGEVTVKGGYDDIFSESGGLPSILGKVTLSAGTTRFRNIIVRQPTAAP